MSVQFMRTIFEYKNQQYEWYNQSQFSSVCVLVNEGQKTLLLHFRYDNDEAFRYLVCFELSCDY